MILPKGTAVTVFQTSDDGRWMKAQYGDNYGWIYNRALGAGKNYSSINLSTLPAVADDIVFDLNLNKRRIYNYVYDIGYRNTGNDTTENLCVDALRYGTGSCYHHAALLNYLYNRCGYETITVTGTDYLTGGDHGWCLSKTSEGWRHVDAQMIITYDGVFDNSNQYFVTDAHISQFFGWNRNGVPAAV
ncbi:MAG: transglutaminase domain-containing protein [Ruminococcus sp.]|nr:transglutaminase domain-containing protein [Ruminococcus sp.]MBQ1686736.1 transglutaminase domain-containing protein [Ruminococcus sp.]